MSKPRRKERPPKRVLTLPDLEQSKAAVLNSLTSNSGQRMGQWNDAKSAADYDQLWKVPQDQGSKL